ncbi:flavin reductase family protein [Halioxenophilus aromaticivorans]|uniref:Flavin reductase family protein n=1 Tax=Halioxenophilus aromaticivorans TaxID=1306992 RepID=A0AAV3U9M1_9ALTE
MIKHLAELSPNKRYRLITQCLVPRPVAWVLTGNADDSYNLAPFSYFGGVASDPPLLMLSIGKKPDGSDKDTRKNIAERGDFVVHIPTGPEAEIVTATSASLDYGQSEVSAQALETETFGDFSLPRLKAAKIAFACSRYRLEEITPSQAMILGEIKTIYVADDIASETDGKVMVDTQKLNPLSRLGGNDYGLLGEIKDVPRPK